MSSGWEVACTAFDPLGGDPLARKNSPTIACSEGSQLTVRRRGLQIPRCAESNRRRVELSYFMPSGVARRDRSQSQSGQADPADPPDAGRGLIIDARGRHN